jgi:hypothetical protein
MAKLTLSIDAKVATRAKRYAKKHRISVSSMVETYLDLVSRPPKLPEDLPPILRELRGSLKRADIRDYYKHLEEKYS